MDPTGYPSKFVSYVIMFYTSLRMILLSLVVIFVYFGYYAKIFKGSKPSIMNDENRMVRYLKKCIADSRHNEDLIPKCKFFIQSNPRLINMQTKHQGCTLFQIACNYGVPEIVSFMMELGADVNVMTNMEQSTLYLAIIGIVKYKSENFDILKMLIKAGVPVNKPSTDGFTPLMLAAIYGHDDLVKWLLMNGADPAITRQQYTACQLANQMGFESTAALLNINTKETEDNKNEHQKIN